MMVLPEKNKNNILLYGYGNPGRQDDGLGPAFIDTIETRLQELNIKGVELDSNYQLNIEDAANIADKDLVIFIDASVEDISDFYMTKVKPSAEASFTMHAASPAFILDLCQRIYQKTPETWLLHIKGYEWEMKEALTEKAVQNLEKAIVYILDILKNQNENTIHNGMFSPN